MICFTVNAFWGVRVSLGLHANRYLSESIRNKNVDSHQYFIFRSLFVAHFLCVRHQIYWLHLQPTGQVSYPDTLLEKHSRVWWFPSFLFTTFCLVSTFSQVEAFVLGRYEECKESWLKLTPWEPVPFGLTGSTHIPSQGLHLRRHQYWEGDRIVLNLVAKYDLPPLLKNTRLKSIGEPRGEPETGGGNGSLYFCRISPSFSGEGTLNHHQGSVWQIVLPTRASLVIFQTLH